MLEVYTDYNIYMHAFPQFIFATQQMAGQVSRLGYSISPLAGGALARSVDTDIKSKLASLSMASLRELQQIHK